MVISALWVGIGLLLKWGNSNGRYAWPSDGEHPLLAISASSARFQCYFPSHRLFVSDEVGSLPTKHLKVAKLHRASEHKKAEITQRRASAPPSASPTVRRFFIKLYATCLATGMGYRVGNTASLAEDCPTQLGVLLTNADGTR